MNLQEWDASEVRLDPTQIRVFTAIRRSCKFTSFSDTSSSIEFKKNYQKLAPATPIVD